MNLDELERLAKAATPSLPSATWIDYAAWIGVGGNPQCRLDEGRQNAFRSYIAACSPETIMGLIEAVRGAEAKVNRLNDLIDKIHNAKSRSVSAVNHYQVHCQLIDALRDLSAPNT